MVEIEDSFYCQRALRVKHKSVKSQRGRVKIFLIYYIFQAAELNRFEFLKTGQVALISTTISLKSYITSDFLLFILTCVNHC